MTKKAPTKKAEPMKGDSFRRGYLVGHDAGFAKAMKACGGCELCYGKGYSTQGHGGRTVVLPCKCPRGIALAKLAAL